MKKTCYLQTAPATSKRVLKDLLDDDPEYPMYAYIEELDAFFDGVADGPWDVQHQGDRRQRRGRHGEQLPVHDQCAAGCNLFFGKHRRS